MEWTNLINNWR